MGDDDDSHLGLYASVFAAVMVVALSLMALFALDPAPLQMAQSDTAISETWRSDEPAG